MYGIHIAISTQYSVTRMKCPAFVCFIHSFIHKCFASIVALRRFRLSLSMAASLDCDPLMKMTVNTPKKNKKHAINTQHKPRASGYIVAMILMLYSQPNRTREILLIVISPFIDLLATPIRFRLGSSMRVYCFDSKSQ